ncbi:MAG: nitroreductase [Hyphomicrobiaceae bacterium]
MSSDIPDVTLDVRSAVTGRKSVRGFKPDPVPLALVTRILEEASRAPSGTNTQPWRVHIAMGAARDRLTAAVTEAAKAGPQQHEYLYSPETLPEPYLSRRRKVGFDLYGIAGIARGDMAGRQRQALKNYTFFGAPVGLFFTMDRRLEYGSWLDLGMFMQNVMTLARGYGLETCPQAAWIYYGPVVHKALPIPDEEILISGMALGVPDWSVPENKLITERAPAADFVVVHGA